MYKKFGLAILTLIFINGCTPTNTLEVAQVASTMLNTQNQSTVDQALNTTNNSSEMVSVMNNLVSLAQSQNNNNQPQPTSNYKITTITITTIIIIIIKTNKIVQVNMPNIK